jgi:hypothetical protein
MESYAVRVCDVQHMLVAGNECPRCGENNYEQLPISQMSHLFLFVLLYNFSLVKDSI